MQKYSDILESNYGDNVGMVSILGQVVQLCDHLEPVEGRYYATAFRIDVKDPKILSDLGAPSRKLVDGSHIIYLSERLLEAARPKYDDNGATFRMVDRLLKNLYPLNRKLYARAS